MKRSAWIAVIFVLISAAELRAEPHGSVLFSWSGGITSIRLQDLSSREIISTSLTSMDDRFEGLARLSDTKVLVTRGLPGFGQTLHVLDMTTENLSPLTAGYRPTALANRDEFVFFFGGLYVGSAADLRVVHKVLSIENPQSYAVAVSPTEVVFQKESDAAAGGLLRYNVAEDKVSALVGLPLCIPYVWRTKSEQLLCGGARGQSFFLLTLDGHRSETVSLPQGSVPVLYVEPLDAVVLNVPRSSWLRGETWDLWLYELSSGKRVLLQKDVITPRGGAIWFEDQ